MSLCRAFYWVTILVAIIIIIRWIPGPKLEIVFSTFFWASVEAYVTAAQYVWGRCLHCLKVQICFLFFQLLLLPPLRKCKLGQLILLTHAECTKVISVNCDILTLHQSRRLLEGVQESDVRDKKKKKAEFRLWFWKNTEKKTQQVLSCVIHISNWDMSVSWSANFFHRLKYVSHRWMCWTDIQGSLTAPLTLVISQLFLSLTSTFAIGSEMSRKFILSHKCLQHSETENFTVFEKDSYCFPYRVIHQECVCV